MPLRVVDLFAGVGGFRLGLEDADPRYSTVWFNQWEPGSRAQHAWHCYVQRFLSDELAPPQSNTDISKVVASAIPDHDLLVGGFPCQDYSVATTLDKAAGLQGKKGVLWWEIDRIIAEKTPAYLLLENVDRLLKSPASQRGRDFAMVLACLARRGYVVEWRVLNAADYGHPQRRRRVFIFAAERRTGIARRITKAAGQPDHLHRTGFFADEFPTSFEVIDQAPATFQLPRDLQEISDEFAMRFQNAGCMVDSTVWTTEVTPQREPQAVLGKVLENGAIDSGYFLDKARLKDWKYAKGPKREPRTAKNGHTYVYSEGGMQFPDLHETPARTILTSEGNRTPNRSTHLVEDPKTRELRFLTPLEVERVMGFRDGWTAGMPERWRYFTMGNALVVPLVTRMGRRLLKWVEQAEPMTRRDRLLRAEGKRQAKPILVAPTIPARRPRRKA